MVVLLEQWNSTFILKFVSKDSKSLDAMPNVQYLIWNNEYIDFDEKQKAEILKILKIRMNRAQTPKLQFHSIKEVRFLLQLIVSFEKLLLY